MKKLMLMALCASSLMPVPAAHAQRHRPDRDDRQVHRPDRDDRQIDRPDRDNRRYHRSERGDRPGFDGRHHLVEARHRQWRRGERFDPRYARQYGAIDYRRYRGLRPPPRGYRYVRSGNDAVLVGIATGIVAAVIANAAR
jgi:Ni/Co efflux regulator RcnB